MFSELLKSEPRQYKPKSSFSKSLIFFFGYIPRKKAKAPKPTRPKPDFNSEYTLELLEKIQQQISQLPSLQKNAFFNHPMFGHLNLKKTLAFLPIHTRHHLKIIRDIKKAV
ncbi:MAG: hypothetical protein C4K58_04120 [Flavobacteriaceae bacterium]|nr:MAG: hypothetical protein C4K58_04120 [Flavobacteriaceae bacterium]